jgi:hypothetical protein
MEEKALAWVTQMKTGRLSRQDIWTALNSTILRTLHYPLPALNMTKKQCEKIMSILLQYALPALGFCRTFPRAIVFSPKEYFGLGILHLHTIQEILRLKDIIKHQFAQTLTGLLYSTSLEYLHLELGSFNQLATISFSIFSPITTDSLVKSSWQFLHTNNLHLRTSLQWNPPRERDRLIMELVTSYTTDYGKIGAIKKCRLFLRTIFLSDITDASGTHILDKAWLGVPRLNLHRKRNWPNQGHPTADHWNEW